mmetsp:Transcript_15010/g.26078  ORF Transcript_15010/g.26078 Transcript_15010/m.26078 type:complete len:224 (-) Transcript_15010:136-807(-)
MGISAGNNSILSLTFRSTIVSNTAGLDMDAEAPPTEDSSATALSCLRSSCLAICRFFCSLRDSMGWICSSCSSLNVTLFFFVNAGGAGPSVVWLDDDDRSSSDVRFTCSGLLANEFASSCLAFVPSVVSDVLESPALEGFACKNPALKPEPNAFISAFVVSWSSSCSSRISFFSNSSSFFHLASPLYSFGFDVSNGLFRSLSSSSATRCIASNSSMISRESSL